MCFFHQLIDIFNFRDFFEVMFFHYLHFPLSCKKWGLNEKMLRNETKKNQSGKLMKFSFVFLSIFENQIFFKDISILKRNYLWGYFKSWMSKCPKYDLLLPPTSVSIELPSQRTKEIKNPVLVKNCEFQLRWTRYGWAAPSSEQFFHPPSHFM